MKSIKSHQSTISRRRDRIYKKFDDDKLNEIMLIFDNTNWYILYEEFTNKYNRTPKVFGIKNGTMEMEYIKGSVIDKLHPKILERDYHLIVSDMYKILSDIFDFYRYTEKWFLHTDMTISNLLWNEKNKRLYLLDPDSWAEWEHPMFYHHLEKTHSVITQLLTRSLGLRVF